MKIATGKLQATMKRGRRFYLLALSQKQVRLFRCDTTAVLEEVDLAGKGIPLSLADSLKEVETQKQWQSHTISSRAGTSPKSIAHGHGEGRDDEKLRIEEFLRAVARGIDRLLGQEKAPIVLAAVEYMVPIYRRVSRSTRVLEKGVTGSPDRRSIKDVHRDALELLLPQLRSERLNPSAGLAERKKSASVKI